MRAKPNFGFGLKTEPRPSHGQTRKALVRPAKQGRLANAPFSVKEKKGFAKATYYLQERGLSVCPSRHIYAGNPISQRSCFNEKELVRLSTQDS